MDAGAKASLAADSSRVQALEAKLRDLEKRLAQVEGQVAEDRVALVVFSGDLDRVLAAFAQLGGRGRLVLHVQRSLGTLLPGAAATIPMRFAPDTCANPTS